MGLMAERVDQFETPITETPPPKQPTIKDQTTRWSSIISSVLDVRTVIQYINTAERGLLRPQMEMFDRMVERDPHLEGVLQSRRMALTQEEWIVMPGDEEDKRSIAAAEMVTADLVGLPDFDDSVDGLLDGIPKGIAVQEIVYADDWSLEDLKEVPGKLLDWQEPELRVMADGLRPVEMEPNKFIRHSPRLKSGSPVRRGLMRTLAVYWCISHYAMEDWAGYSEVFGQPLRLGKYDPNAKEGDINILREALINIGSDASAVIPDTMLIEFPEPKSRTTGGGQTISPMEGIINHIEKKMSIAVLGQNLTTQSESGSGTLAGGAQERVLKGITRADGRQVGVTLRRDLFRPLVGFRMGFDVALPYIKWDLDDPVDQESRSKVFQGAQDLGMPISKAQVREELQLKEPADDEDLLEQQPSSGTGMFSATPSALAVLAQTNAGSASVSSAMRANDKLAAAAAEVGKEAPQQILALIGKAAESAGSLEEMLTKIKIWAPNLEELLAEAGIPMEEFEDEAARNMVTADFNGRTAVRAERKV
jgi:phage gp29-like protein